jgi:hypothetical protein
MNLTCSTESCGERVRRSRLWDGLRRVPWGPKMDAAGKPRGFCRVVEGLGRSAQRGKLSAADLENVDRHRAIGKMQSHGETLAPFGPEPPEPLRPGPVERAASRSLRLPPVEPLASAIGIGGDDEARRHGEAGASQGGQIRPFAPGQGNGCLGGNERQYRFGGFCPCRQAEGHERVSWTRLPPGPGRQPDGELTEEAVARGTSNDPNGVRRVVHATQSRQWQPTWRAVQGARTGLSEHRRQDRQDE